MKRDKRYLSKKYKQVKEGRNRTEKRRTTKHKKEAREAKEYFSKENNQSIERKLIANKRKNRK